LNGYLNNLAIANDTISQIRAAQAPLRRQYTKQQVKLLSQTGILKIQDVNQSIAERKAKDAAAEKRRLQKQWEKVHGKQPLPTPTQESGISIKAARAAEANGDIYFLDSQSMCCE
jgi:preprotein translocase subunit SecD